MSQTELLFEVLNEFIEGSLVLLFITIFLGKRDFFRINSLKSIVFAVFYTAFAFWATQYLFPGFHSFCILIFIIFLCSYLTNSNIYATLISAILFLILMAACEYIFLFLEAIYFGVGITELSVILKYKIIGVLLSKTLCLIVIIFLYSKELMVFRMKIFKRENSHIVFILFQMFIILIFFVAINFLPRYENNIVWFNILSCVVIILLIILSYIDFKERDRLIKMRVNFGIQEVYIKNIESLLNIIRQEKHDFRNHLNTILAMCTLNKSDSLDKIKQYITNFDEKLDSSAKFYNSGNDYIDGLLAVKSNYAFKNNIHLDIDFDVSLEALTIESGNLISVFANIIDNAFEAIKRVDGETAKIFSLTTFIEEDWFGISFSNNGPPINELDLKKIFNSGHTSKVNDGKNHGFGLSIVKQIIEENGGKVSITSTDEETEFLVRFPYKQLS